jgi:DNA-binding NarL/FixJ family response regulator
MAYSVYCIALATRKSRVKESSSRRRPPAFTIYGPGQPLAQDSEAILSNTILIVDDSTLIRRALRACLEEGHQWTVCGEAADGSAALEMAKELKPDLIVLDLSMPDMNGFQLARELKHNYPALPLVMFTGFKTPQLEKEALASGCNAVVSKSEHQQTLFDNIQRLLPH